MPDTSRGLLGIQEVVQIKKLPPSSSSYSQVDVRRLIYETDRLLSMRLIAAMTACSFFITYAFFIDQENSISPII